MVGPDSELEGSVRRMATLLVSGAKVTSPHIAIFLRKGYGLGAQAMVGGSFHDPFTLLLGLQENSAEWG